MTSEINAVVPIRGFAGMTRLADHLTPNERRTLSMTLATTVLSVMADAGWRVLVVTDDQDVQSWARLRDADVVADGGVGLNESVSNAVRGLGAKPWIVVHADLPLIATASVQRVAHHVDAGQWVMCPSIDGGTNVIAGFGPFEFSYGPGSFTRHLAMIPDATVIATRNLAIEVDTIEHYRALSRLGYVPTLAS